MRKLKTAIYVDISKPYLVYDGVEANNNLLASSASTIFGGEIYNLNPMGGVPVRDRQRSNEGSSHRGMMNYRVLPDPILANNNMEAQTNDNGQYASHKNSNAFGQSIMRPQISNTFGQHVLLQPPVSNSMLLMYDGVANNSIFGAVNSNVNPNNGARNEFGNSNAPSPRNYSRGVKEMTGVLTDQYKAIDDEGMPMYGRPFMRCKLYIHFTVEFPDYLSLHQVSALEKIPPPKAQKQLTDMEIDECEETTLHDVDIEQEMRRRQAQAQQEAYDEDDDMHGGAQRIQCAQQS